MDGKKKLFPEDLKEKKTLPLQIAYPSNNYFRVNMLVGKHEKLAWIIFENFQRQVTKWINNKYSSDYKSRLSQLNLLPLPMFLQTQDLLILSRITKCFSESELGKLCLVNENSRRIGPTFQVPHFKSQFAHSSFVCRTLRLANGLPPCIDIQEPRGLKMALIRYFTQIFIANFNELTPCTWRIMFDSPNCRDIRQAAI